MKKYRRADVRDYGQDPVGGNELEEMPPSLLILQNPLSTTALIHSRATYIPEEH